MSRGSTSSSESSSLARVRAIADFQFGRGAGKGLFPDGCTFLYSRTGRVRQVLFGGERLATLRASDGRLTLGIAGAARLLRVLPPPAYRVSIRPDVAEFARAGKNVFCRHVVAADPDIRAGDEVMVVTGDDDLCATGTAVVPGADMPLITYGVAVKVRQGASAHAAGKHQPEEDEAGDEAARDADRADRGRAADRDLDGEG